MAEFDHIVPFYNVLFPAKPAQLDFLQGSLPDNAAPRAADIACGTGQQLEGLSDRDIEVWGLDLNEGMIEELKKRRPDLAGNVTTGDMREADRALGAVMPGPAGLVYCIGNSLVQLTDASDIQQTLTACAKLLGQGGMFVGQVVNFDRVLAGDYDILPVIERSLPSGESCTLERIYALSETPGCVTFKTKMVTSEGTEEKTNDLYALRREEFEELLRNADFDSCEWFGDYKRAAWTADSPATIVTARSSLAVEEK